MIDAITVQLISLVLIDAPAFELDPYLSCHTNNAIAYIPIMCTALISLMIGHYLVDDIYYGRRCSFVYTPHHAPPQFGAKAANCGGRGNRSASQLTTAVHTSVVSQLLPNKEMMQLLCSKW